MSANITKDEWIAMFREMGLNDAQMKKWHHLFETRHPDGHQSFLTWLGISSTEIEKIRTEHR